MMSNIERLVYMANQIARNFEVLGEEVAAASTADHIATFWDPRMKEQIFEQVERADGGLSPTAARAVLQLRDGGAPPPQTRATEFNAVDESGHTDAG